MSAKWGERMFSVSDLATLAETQRLQMPKKRQDTTALTAISFTLKLNLGCFINYNE